MPGRLFTSESVTEGHPDKIADQISDSVLDALLTADPQSRVAVETLVTTGLVVVAGEVTTDEYVPVADIVRRQGARDRLRLVEEGLRRRLLRRPGRDRRAVVRHRAGRRRRLRGACRRSTDPLDRQGAGDQGLMFGYACDETPGADAAADHHRPPAGRAAVAVRKDGTMAYLRPDGKTQVTIEYDGDRPSASTPSSSPASTPATSISTPCSTPDIKKHVVDEVLSTSTSTPATTACSSTRPAGSRSAARWATRGLTGRKIIIDTYGGMARHGGGAFSGKDPSKVDRRPRTRCAGWPRTSSRPVWPAGARCRWPMRSARRSRSASTSTASAPRRSRSTHIRDAVLEVFDLRPAAIIRDLDLLRPIYALTAAYGHFGRELPDFTWERTDRVDALRAAAGL